MSDDAVTNEAAYVKKKAEYLMDNHDYLSYYEEFDGYTYLTRASDKGEQFVILEYGENQHYLNQAQLDEVAKNGKPQSLLLNGEPYIYPPPNGEGYQEKDGQGGYNITVTFDTPACGCPDLSTHLSNGHICPNHQWYSKTVYIRTADGYYYFVGSIGSYPGFEAATRAAKFWVSLYRNVEGYVVTIEYPNGGAFEDIGEEPKYSPGSIRWSDGSKDLSKEVEKEVKKAKENKKTENGGIKIGGGSGHFGGSGGGGITKMPYGGDDYKTTSLLFNTITIENLNPEVGSITMYINGQVSGIANHVNPKLSQIIEVGASYGFEAETNDQEYVFTGFQDSGGKTISSENIFTCSSNATNSVYYYGGFRKRELIPVKFVVEPRKAFEEGFQILLDDNYYEVIGDTAYFYENSQVTVLAENISNYENFYWHIEGSGLDEDRYGVNTFSFTATSPTEVKAICKGKKINYKVEVLYPTNENRTKNEYIEIFCSQDEIYYDDTVLLYVKKGESYKLEDNNWFGGFFDSQGNALNFGLLTEEEGENNKGAFAFVEVIARNDFEIYANANVELAIYNNSQTGNENLDVSNHGVSEIHYGNNILSSEENGYIVATIPLGTTVEVVAKPENGYFFNSWYKKPLEQWSSFSVDMLLYFNNAFSLMLDYSNVKSLSYEGSCVYAKIVPEFSQTLKKYYVAIYNNNSTLNDEIDDTLSSNSLFSENEDLNSRIIEITEQEYIDGVLSSLDYPESEITEINNQSMAVLNNNSGARYYCVYGALVASVISSALSNNNLYKWSVGIVYSINNNGIFNEVVCYDVNSSDNKIDVLINKHLVIHSYWNTVNLDGIFKFEGSNESKTFIWRSKRFVFNMPINLSTARVYALDYPLQLNVYGSESPDDKKEVAQMSRDVQNQNSFRLQRVRPEKYLEIEVIGNKPVTEVDVSTSMGDLWKK